MTEPLSIGIIASDSHLTGVRFSPCGKILAGPAFDQTVRRWDLAAATNEGEKDFSVPELAKVSGYNGFVSALEFHPHRLLAFSADSWGKLRAWPYLSENPQPIWELPQAHDGWLRDIAVGGDGDWLTTCGRDRMVRMFSSHDGALIREFSGHEEDVFALAAHPSGEWLVSGDLLGRIIQWDVASGKMVREFDGADFHLLHRLQDIAGLRKLCFSADGSQLFAAGSIPTGGANVRGHGRVRSWDFETGKQLSDDPVGVDQKDIFAHDIAVHRDGFFAAVTTGQSGSGSLILQRPGETEPLFKLSKGTVNCHGVALSPDHKRIAVTATNTGSAGNGRRLDKEGNYPANHSPIHLFELVDTAG